MRLELRDLESETTHAIFESGAVLGRERRATDISLRDDSISKRHARIFVDDGRWLIEDLGSSNGTYVRDQRIAEPTPLSSGVIFTLAHRRFEVVHLELGGEVLSSDLHPVEEHTPPAEASRILSALPRAVAYFGSAVPKLVARSFRSGATDAMDEAAPSLSAPELAAYGLVAGAGASAFVTVCAVLAGGLRETGALGLLSASLPVVALAGAVGAALGFLARPLLQWFLVRLDGHSSPQGRTQAVLDGFGLGILSAVPAGLGALASLLETPVASIVPVVLGVGVAALCVHLVQHWSTAFGISRTARSILVGLAVLALLGSVVQGARQLLGRSGSDPALAAIEATARARAERAEADAREIAEANLDPPDPDSRPPAADDVNGIEIEPPPIPGPGEEPPAPAVESAASEPKEGKPPSETPPRDVSADNGENPYLSRDHPRGRTPFRRFVDRRKAIERAISDDPSLLNRRDVLKEYQALWRKTYELRERWSRLARRKPAWERDKIYARKASAEIFKSTSEHVDKLWNTLFKEERRSDSPP